MNKKLTLKLDGAVIDRAKAYAGTHRQSVSGLVENYLRTLTESAQPNPRNSKLVAELSGLITLPDAYDEEEDYREFKRDRSRG